MDSAGTAVVELEVRIGATPERVWDGLVTRTREWWPATFASSAASRGVLIEGRLGGRWVEDYGEGHGATWYTITLWDPPRALGALGHISPAFGGPAVSMVQIVLEGLDAATVLKFQDALIGRVDGVASIRAGWEELLGRALKGFVEGIPVK